MTKESSSDHDHTDELPVLLETVVLDEGGMPHLLGSAIEDTSEHTALFVPGASTGDPEAELNAEIAAREAKIQAVEADIARLSSRCQDVERQLAEKDAAIAELNATIDTLRQALLDKGLTEQRLGDEIAERDSRLRVASTAQERAGRERETRDKEAQQLRADLAQARQAVAALEAQRAAAAAPAADSAEIQALREHSAALETYIAGRRAWWDETKASETTLAKRVAALEHELTMAAQKLNEAEALSIRESARATALRTELVDYARRLEGSERELRALRAITPAVATGAADSAPAASEAPQAPPKHIETASAPLPGPEPAARADGDADSALSQGIEAIAQLEAEVGYKRQQVAAQLIELRDREQRLTALTTEIERLRHGLAASQTELQQSRSDVARLERAILDKDRALQTRDMRIATLQNELDQRLGALQKLNSMDHALQGLQSRMSEQLRPSEPADAAHSPELICLTGDAPKRFALTKRTMTVGRSPRCDLQIVTDFVSREHARISLVEDAAVIEDLGSRNGVFVNAVKVSRQQLHQGDLITIGETQFRFIESAAH